MKKRIIRAIASGLMLFVILAAPVLAVDSYAYYMDITVTDTSGAARTNVVVMTGVSPTNLYNAGYILATGLDVSIKDGNTITATELQSYLNSTQTALVLPTLGANQSRTIRMYMGYSPNKTEMPIIVGDGGYITTTDAAALEPANNFEIEISGYFDTSTASRYIVKKDGALELYTSNASEITGKIYGAETSSVAIGTSGALTNVYGANWVMQSFVSLGELCSKVLVEGTKYSNPAGNLVLGIYATSGGNPTGAALATSSVVASSIGGTATNVYFTISPPLQLTNGVTYALVINCVNGDASNYIQIAYRSASNVYADGQSKTSANSGSTWSNLNYDLFAVVYNLPSKTVTGAVASGEHTIKLTADATNLKLYDGVTEKDSEALAGVSVTNNANNWIWLNNNSVPYCDYIKLTIGGVLIVTYKPVSLYTNPTLNDVTGAAQDGTITWGSNTSLDIAVSGTGSYASTVNTSAVDGDGLSDNITDITQPPNWYAAGSVSLPFYSTFNSAATSIGMTTQTLYVWVILGLAAGAGVALVVFTGSPMLAAVACGVIIAAGVNAAVLSAWMLYTYIILAIAILYVVRHG